MDFSDMTNSFNSEKYNSSAENDTCSSDSEEFLTDNENNITSVNETVGSDPEYSSANISNSNLDIGNAATSSDKDTSNSNSTLRRSLRIRRASSKVEETIVAKPSRKITWTKTERNQLLEALHVVGDKNITELARHVPTKTPSQIKCYIHSLTLRVNKIMSASDPSVLLGHWVKKMKVNARNVESRSYDPFLVGFLFIPLFEDLAHPTESEGVDFKLMYEYLFCEMAEILPPPLDIKTKLFLLKALKEVDKTTADLKPSMLYEICSNKDPQDGEEWPFTSKIMNPLNFPKLEFDVSCNDSS